MAFDFGRSVDRNWQLLLAYTFAFSIACAVAKSQGLVPDCTKTTVEDSHISHH